MSLESLINQSQKSGYPQSLKIRARRQNRLLVNGSWGKSYRYFDIGSMTKIMATTALLMSLFEQKKIDLDERVEYYLPYFRGRLGAIKIKNLLRHISGLRAWAPFFKSLLKIKNEPQLELKRVFLKEKVGSGRKCVYSDLDFILLGWVIEEALDQPLDEACRDRIFRPLGLNDTFYNDKGLKKQLFAPTERSSYRGVVQSEVFDDNAWSMGGVAGHAGLFSTLDDVDFFGNYLLSILTEKRKGIWKKSTVELFVTRAVSRREGDWALGFTIPSRPVSTAGQKVSDSAFGHVGFTGTSLWVDRERQTVVSILSNRTFPDRNDERFRELRRNLHDAIWDKVDGR